MQRGEHPANFFSSYQVTNTIEPIYTGGRIQYIPESNLLCLPSGTQVHLRCAQTGSLKCALKAPKVVDVMYGGEAEEEGYFQAFCFHSSMLFTVNREGLLESWNTDASEPQLIKSWKTANAKKSPVRLMLHHPSAQLLILALADGSVSGWDSKGGFCTHNYKGSSPCSSIAFHDLHLLVGREDGSLSIYDLNASGATPTVISAHVSAITAISVANDTIITAGRDRIISVCDFKSKKLLRTIPVFESVEDACLIGDSIALVGDSGKASLWDLTSAKNVMTSASLSSTEVHQLKQVFPVDGQSLLVVSDELQLIRLASTSLQEESRIMGHFGEVTDFALLPQSDSLVVSSNGPELALFSPEYRSGSLQCRLLRGHTEGVISLAVSEDDLIVSGSRDNTIRVWPVVGSDESIVGEGHTDSVSCVAVFKPGEKEYLIASASPDLTMKLWSFSGKDRTLSAKWTVKAHDKEINTVCFSPDGKLVITGGQDKVIKIWSVVDGALLHTLTGHRRGVWSLDCVQAQEAYLVSGSADKTVKIWRLSDDFSCIKTFEGHANSVLKVAFLNSGSQVVSTGSDGLIKLWDVKRSECIVTFDEHVDRIWALAVVGDGDYLITGDASANIKFWKDCSREEHADELRKQDELLLKEQELQVLLLRKEIPKAVLLALSLEQPFRLLSLFEDLLRGKSVEEALQMIEQLLKEITQAGDQLKLLSYLREWNIHYRRSFASQVLLAGLLRSPRLMGAKELAGEIKTLLQGILPYTGKHFERTDELMIESQIVDFVLLQMN